MAAVDREDFLTEDADIPGQKFCLLSFLSPEKVLAKKEHHFFEKFLKTFEFNFRTTSYEKFLMEKVKARVLMLTSQEQAIHQINGVCYFTNY